MSPHRASRLFLRPLLSVDRHRTSWLSTCCTPMRGAIQSCAKCISDRRGFGSERGMRPRISVRVSGLWSRSQRERGRVCINVGGVWRLSSL